MTAKTFSALLLGLSVVTPCAFSQSTATTDPFGVVAITVPAQSDAVLAVPLFRPAVFQGRVQGLAGTHVTLNAAPTLTAGVTYAMVLASGAKEGLIAKITAQSGAEVDVELDAGDDLSGVASGASGEVVSIVPYWTPASLFPTAPAAGTEILAYEGQGAGINLAAPQVFGYNGSIWEDGSTLQDVSGRAMRFGTSFILRNNAITSMRVRMVGVVPMMAHRSRLATLAADTDQDIRLGYISPVPEAITALQIPAAAGDAILGYDNNAPGKNKSAAVIYAYDGTQWVDDITGLPMDSTVKLQPGYGYVYRKFRTGSAQSAIWQHVQAYLPQ